MPSSHWKLGARHGTAFRGNQLHQHLDLRLLVSRTKMIHLCCLRPSGCGTLLQQPSTLMPHSILLVASEHARELQKLIFFSRFAHSQCLAFLLQLKSIPLVLSVNEEKGFQSPSSCCPIQHLATHHLCLFKLNSIKIK